MSCQPFQPDRLPPAAHAITETLPSSRVLDTAAFEKYAGALRGLIREAAGEADLLRQAADEASRTGHTLSTTGSELEAKLSRFAGLVPVIEERLKEIETLLSASAAHAARAAVTAQADLDERIAAAIREHLRSHLLRDIQPHIERLIAARLDGFLTDFGALTFPEGRRAA